MGRQFKSRQLLGLIRASLRAVIEPRLDDIDSKLDHLIDGQRETRSSACWQPKGADETDSDDTDVGGDADVFSED